MSDYRPRWKRYLSPRFVLGKVGERGLIWCARALLAKIYRLLYRKLELHKLPRYFGVLFKGSSAIFHNELYHRINQRRQEHLAVLLTSLDLSLAGASVLEVGAGIGDHTSFFVDRGCRVCVTEPRESNLKILRRRWGGEPGLTVRALDLDAPDLTFVKQFDVVYCYGVLYHLCHPHVGVRFMAEQRCKGLLLLESWVSLGDEAAVNLVQEDVWDPTHAIGGTGCRPTRSWIFNELKSHFEYVYTTLTQPWHREFPLDWTVPADGGVRAVFIASRWPLNSSVLTTEISKFQRRH